MPSTLESTETTVKSKVAWRVVGLVTALITDPDPFTLNFIVASVITLGLAGVFVVAKITSPSLQSKFSKKVKVISSPGLITLPSIVIEVFIEAAVGLIAPVAGFILLKEPISDISSVGGVVGAFLITVTCSSSANIGKLLALLVAHSISLKASISEYNKVWVVLLAPSWFVVIGDGRKLEPFAGTKPVPAKPLDILTFLGSYLSSVQNKKSSNIFIPCIDILL